MPPLHQPAVPLRAAHFEARRAARIANRLADRHAARHLFGVAVRLQRAGGRRDHRAMLLSDLPACRVRHLAAALFLDHLAATALHHFALLLRYQLARRVRDVPGPLCNGSS